MKQPETGKSKIQKICDILKLETIEPAQQEAKEIIENAHMMAKEIIEKAKIDAEKILIETSKEIEKKLQVCQASLNLACRQGIDLLKQNIEQTLFLPTVEDLAKNALSEKEVIAKLVGALVTAIEKEGIDSDLTLYIGKAISATQLASLLTAKILEKLSDKVPIAADFPAGMKLYLRNKKITLDFSDEAVKELLAAFVSKELREKLFHA